MTRVLLFHGSNGSPKDRTATYLAEHYETYTPSLPTSSYRISVRIAEESCHQFKPDVIVAESFGAALVYELVQDGAWKGPTVLLCPAIHNVRRSEGLSKYSRWSSKQPLVVVHGTRDTVISNDDTERVLNAGDTDTTTLIMVDDDHSMTKIVDGVTQPQLKELVDKVAAMSASRA